MLLLGIGKHLTPESDGHFILEYQVFDCVSAFPLPIVDSFSKILYKILKFSIFVV